MKIFLLSAALFFITFFGCQKESPNKEAPENVMQDSLIDTTAANHKEKGELAQEIISKKDNSTMELIPAGKFVYGINKTERDSIIKSLDNPLLQIFNYEFPESKKFLHSYYIDKYEITNKQYGEFLKETGHRKPKYWAVRLYNQPDQPVVGIGWDDAEKYAEWAGKRLPSEEEWEKAARGTDGRIWPWGNNSSGDNYNGKSHGSYAPLAVGSFPAGASPYGLMDMAGNVYEMTTGIWGSTGKAMRGGSYLNSGAYTRTMFRWAMDDPENGAEYLGFRCVMDTAMISGNAVGKAEYIRLLRRQSKN